MSKVIESLRSFPPGANPMNHDGFNMGMEMGKGLFVMMMNHASEECNWLIFIDIKTGKRVRLDMKLLFEEHGTPE